MLKRPTLRLDDHQLVRVTYLPMLYIHATFGWNARFSSHTLQCKCLLNILLNSVFSFVFPFAVVVFNSDLFPLISNKSHSLITIGQRCFESPISDEKSSLYANFVASGASCVLFGALVAANKCSNPTTSGNAANSHRLLLNYQYTSVALFDFLTTNCITMLHWLNCICYLFLRIQRVDCLRWMVCAACFRSTWHMLWLLLK